MIPASRFFHASCVAIGGRGVLLLGGSGSGKSDLALQLIDAGAQLVGDDQVVITKEGDGLVAAPAPKLEGLVEARGMGLLTLDYVPRAWLGLAVSLVGREEVERMPDAQFFDCFGVLLPLLSLHAFDHATCAKIRLFIGQL